MSAITLSNAFLLVGAALVVVGVFSSLIASRFGAPLLLVFLIIGMLAGEEGPGGIKFDDYQLTYLVGSGALAVILFDGGLRTRFARFRGTLFPALLLATVGVFITALIVGVVAGALLGIGLLGGVLVGVIVSSTDAAAVFFLIRAHGLQLKRRLAATLEIESGTNDPVAVFLTVVVVSLLLASGRFSGWQIAIDLAREAVVGVVLGVAGGVGPRMEPQPCDASRRAASAVRRCFGGVHLRVRCDFGRLRLFSPSISPAWSSEIGRCAHSPRSRASMTP